METMQAKAAATTSSTIVVGNPQSGTEKLTGALKVVINGIEATTDASFANGSVDAYGALKFPKGSITFAPMDVLGKTLTFAATADATGTINPGASGTNMTLKLTMSLTLSGCGTQNIGCTVAGNYNQATGSASLTASGVTVAATTCGAVNAAGGLPTSNTTLTLSLVAAPVIAGPAFAEVESNNTASTANTLPEGTTAITGKFSSSTDVDNFKIDLAAGKTITLTQSVTVTNKVTCTEASTLYSGALFKGTANGTASTSSTPTPTGHIVWVDCGDGGQTPTGTSTATWTTTLKYRNGTSAKQSVLLALQPFNAQMIGSYTIQIAIG